MDHSEKFKLRRKKSVHNHSFSQFKSHYKFYNSNKKFL